MKHPFPENGSSCLPKNLMWPQAWRNAALRLSDGYCICMNGEINLIFYREEHAVVCGWRYSDFSSGLEIRILEFLHPNTVSQHLLFYWSTGVLPLWDLYGKRKSFTYVSVFLLINCLPTGAEIYGSEASSEPVLEEGLQHCSRFEGKTRKICYLLIWESQWCRVGLQVQLFHGISFQKEGHLLKNSFK